MFIFSRYTSVSAPQRRTNSYPNIFPTAVTLFCSYPIIFYFRDLHSEYREVITNFVDWCELNHLHINPCKTRVVVDYRQKLLHTAPRVWTLSWWRSTNNWGTQWTGRHPTLMPSTRRARVVPSYWEEWGPSKCVGHCSRHFMASCMQWPAGAGVAQRRIGRDLTNQSEVPALSWTALWIPLRWWVRGGCWPGWHLSWTTPPSPCMMLCNPLPLPVWDCGKHELVFQ